MVRVAWEFAGRSARLIPIGNTVVFTSLRVANHLPHCHKAFGGRGISPVVRLQYVAFANLIAALCTDADIGAPSIQLLSLAG